MVPDVDRYWELAQRMGASVLAPIADKSYGLRDFAIADPDGFAVRFATRLEDRGMRPASYAAGISFDHIHAGSQRENSRTASSSRRLGESMYFAFPLPEREYANVPLAVFPIAMNPFALFELMAMSPFEFTLENAMTPVALMVAKATRPIALTLQMATTPTAFTALTAMTPMALTALIATSAMALLVSKTMCSLLSLES